MAIKLPDPGNGIPEQKTGNDEWTNMKIVRDNFADQSNAASRLVGNNTGNLMEVGAFGLGSGNIVGQQALTTSPDVSGIYKYDNDTAALMVNWNSGNYSYGITFGYSKASLVLWHKTNGDKARYDFYHQGNTTKDVGTGFLKVSSPVLHVYNDKIDKIHEAKQLDIKVDKHGIGHYEIHGTTGLRKDDGWYMSPPRDIHGNVRCMIDVTEKDGVVILKTYKRKFDLELAAIVHDYDNPIDIPDGACVEFRFNNLPEQLDEPTI